MARNREKACQLCGLTASTLFRCRFDTSAEWQFVCEDCWIQVSQNNALYVYGGTWKARKRL